MHVYKCSAGIVSLVCCLLGVRTVPDNEANDIDADANASATTTTATQQRSSIYKFQMATKTAHNGAGRERARVRVCAKRACVRVYVYVGCLVWGFLICCSCPLYATTAQDSPRLSSMLACIVELQNHCSKSVCLCMAKSSVQSCRIVSTSVSVV